MPLARRLPSILRKLLAALLPPGLILLATPLSSASPLSPGVRWIYLIEGPVPAPSRKFTVAIVDVNLDRERQTFPHPGVQALRNAGTEVICYFSTQYENWREDMKKLVKIEQQLKERLRGRPLGDGWDGEQFLDVRSRLVRDLMQERIVRAKKLGCSGVEPDNVDFYAYEKGTGFGYSADPATARKTAIGYLRFLADTAHSLGLKIALKNAGDIVGTVQPWMDFAIVESCFEYSECRKFDPFVENNKAVLIIEYRAFHQRRCETAKNRGYSLLFKPTGRVPMDGRGIRVCE